VHYLAVKSAYDVMPDATIFIYYKHEPKTEWFVNPPRHQPLGIHNMGKLAFMYLLTLTTDHQDTVSAAECWPLWRVSVSRCQYTGAYGIRCRWKKAMRLPVSPVKVSPVEKVKPILSNPVSLTLDDALSRPLNPCS
jgi:hypothetical protein